MYNLGYLRQIDVNITDLCNKTCSFCPRHNPEIYPNSNEVTTTFSCNSTTTKKDVRVRARQIALEIANTAASEDWKLGTFRLDIF